MAKFKLVSDYDGNDEIIINADNENDALHEAIEKLGYNLCTYNED